MKLRVNELLQERGMTMSDLARSLGIRPTTISGKGELKPSLRKMNDIARVLNVPTWELLHDCGISAYGLPDTVDVVSTATIDVPCPHCGTMTQVTLVTRWSARCEEGTMTEAQPRLREIMNSKGINVKMISERMGVSSASVSSLISDTGTLTYGSMEKLSVALEVEPWELFTDPADVMAETERRRSLMEQRASDKAPEVLTQARCSGCGMIMKVGF